MQTELNSEIVKRAFQTGKICGSLKSIQTELHMGNSKEALASLNELIKYIESDIVPEFYGHDKVDENRNIDAYVDVNTDQRV